MACEYWSRTEPAATFEDAKTLAAALARVGAEKFRVNGPQVTAYNDRDMNELKQAYSVEGTKRALRARGLFVAEKRDAKTGKIKLTVTA
jgi:hypothetical protein